jgi:hypothetical protein
VTDPDPVNTTPLVDFRKPNTSTMTVGAHFS